MSLFAILITALWLIFMVVWLLTSLTSGASIRRRSFVQSSYLRVLWIILVVLVVNFVVPRRYFMAATPFPGIVAACGVVLCALGVALAIWARFYLGRNWGMPMTLRVEHHLVTTGPYAYIRHPIYTGAMLAALGSGLVEPWWFAFFVAFCIYFTFSARSEEKDMHQMFPEYAEYQKRTWMLVPFIL